jgi:hypothetical protein
MFANKHLLSAGLGRLVALVPRGRQPVRPAELAHWQRAYIGVPIDIAVKLLVLGMMVSLAVRATTHESYNGVGHRWHAVHDGQLTHP